MTDIRKINHKYQTRYNTTMLHAEIVPHFHGRRSEIITTKPEIAISKLPVF